MTVTSVIFENTFMTKISTLYSVTTPSTQPGPKEVSCESVALDYEIKACSLLALLLSYVILQSTYCTPSLQSAFKHIFQVEYSKTCGRKKYYA